LLICHQCHRRVDTSLSLWYSFTCRHEVGSKKRIVKIAIRRPDGLYRHAAIFFLFRGCKMCEAKVYFSGDGEERKVMDDVVLVQPEGDAYLLVNLLGEQKLVEGTIEKIDFLHHTLHLGQLQGPSSTRD